VPGDVDHLVRQYAGLVRAAVAKVLGRRDADLGDEVVQRVSEALWKQLRAEQVIEHPASYLYRCAVRETVRIVQRELDRREAPIEEASDVSAMTVDPEDALRARQLAEITEQIVGGLHSDRGTAVRAHLAGFSVEEIMQMHGWPYQKARNLIARGLSELRAQLAARGIP
jgi:RNA polymerase sigma factor (sigma-70 family)